MKPVKLAATGIVAVVFILFTAAFISRGTTLQEPEAPSQGNGFAVLELFTSEGCSSCPPAEALLARIKQEAGDKPVYLLSYHVDYWNRLGWKDIFSKAEFSQRQYQYSQQLSAQVYTPQLVINGRSECVGSDEDVVSEYIKAALNSTTKIAVSLQGQVQDGKMNISYQVSGNVDHSKLLIALVQKQAVSQVKRGENGGRTLTHVNIVHDLRVFGLKSGNQGSEKIELPADFNEQGWEFIGMIQHTETGFIEAANRITYSK
jgi:hypothetical protein